MQKRFDYFVIYANMRTGSNFLEENINDYPGLTCYGEAFNPVFIGGPKKTDLLGVTLEDREAEPLGLLEVMRNQTEGLPGFRFFHDHDPRILAHTLKDQTCAKVILTRNPLDSYVSRKIAAKTGQWRLNDLKNAKKAKITFDRAEFEAHLDRLQSFQLHLMQSLQATGQTAFYIGYEDIANLDILDGLAAFLGVDHQKDRATIKTKVQNPGALEDKVENFAEMQTELASIDRFDLTRTPNFEPRRPPAVPKYVAGVFSPLLFQPIKSNPFEQVLGWMALLNRVEPEELLTDFNQKTLRQWQRDKPLHRSFTVVRHPVKRLHQSFVDYILGGGPRTYKEIRRGLRKKYALPLPAEAPGDDWTADQHRAAFLAFITFVQGNLAGQTGIRVDGAWASQTEVIAGFTRFRMPDVVMREDTLEQELAHLAELIGQEAPELPLAFDNSPVPLDQIYDDDIESAVRAAYQRDYLNFGFGRYRN